MEKNEYFFLFYQHAWVRLVKRYIAYLLSILLVWCLSMCSHNSSKGLFDSFQMLSLSWITTQSKYCRYEDVVMGLISCHEKLEADDGLREVALADLIPFQIVDASIKRENTDY